MYVVLLSSPRAARRGRISDSIGPSHLIIFRLWLYAGITFTTMSYQPNTTNQRKEAREALSPIAQINAARKEDQRRRGKAQAGKYVRVAR